MRPQPALALPAPEEPSIVGKEVVEKKSMALRFADSLASVQGERHDAKHLPRWFKIATWCLVLLPAFSIVIYIVGFFYFLPAENSGVGINQSLSVTATATLGDVLIPDQEGVFLQRGTSSQQTLSLILQYNSRSLQPPVSAQVTTSPTDLRYVLIRQAQVETPENYLVYRISDTVPDQLFQVASKRVPYPRIALIALSMPDGKPWPAGHYMIVVPESGLDSADYWVFFTVS